MTSGVCAVWANTPGDDRAARPAAGVLSRASALGSTTAPGQKALAKNCAVRIILESRCRLELDNVDGVLPAFLRANMGAV